MHMHQQNHWNRVLFYWYQSYHRYQWTISLTNRIRLCLLDMCEKYAPEAHFPGEGRGNGVRDMTLPSLGNLGAVFSEISFPHFETHFMQIGRCSL